MLLDVAAASDVGHVRTVNQDAVHAELFRAAADDGDNALLIVADGLGGHAAGDVASAAALQTIVDAAHDADTPGSAQPFDDPARLAAAVQAANAAIRRRAAENVAWTGMGTTIVVAWVGHGRATIAHAGDSRAYHLRGAELRALTRDHSWVEEEIRAGRLTPEAARSHPNRSVVLRCLGTREPVDVEIAAHIQLADGDQLLLCSDGLHGVVGDAAIAAILSGRHPADSVTRLIAAANDNGGPDNIGVAVLRVAPG